MKIELPSEVLKTLPAPDGKGLVRVSVGLKVKEDGSASLVEMNDVPMPGDDEKEETESESDPADEVLKNNLPEPDAMERDIYAP